MSNDGFRSQMAFFVWEATFTAPLSGILFWILTWLNRLVVVLFNCQTLFVISNVNIRFPFSLLRFTTRSQAPFFIAPHSQSFNVKIDRHDTHLVCSHALTIW